MKTFVKTSTFLRLPFSYPLHKILCLIFGLFPFHINSMCVLINKLKIDVDIDIDIDNRCRY